jgi:hypothetical protein
MKLYLVETRMNMYIYIYIYIYICRLITRQIDEEIMAFCVLCPSWIRYKVFNYPATWACSPSPSNVRHGWTLLEMIQMLCNVECNLIYGLQDYFLFLFFSLIFLRLKFKRLSLHGGIIHIICILIPNLSCWWSTIEFWEVAGRRSFPL